MEEMSTLSPLNMTTEMIEANNNSNYDNGNISYDNGDILDDINIYGILYRVLLTGGIPIISCMGLVTNILTLIVFYQITNWNSTNVGLFTLTIVDFLYCLVNCLYVFIDNLRLYNPNVINSYYKVEPTVRPTIMIIQRLVTMVPPVITTERFFAVIFPLRVKDIWTKRVMSTVLLGTIVFTTLLTTPYFFFFETQTKNTTDGVQYMMTITSFGRQKEFWVPYRIVIVSATRIIPVSLVAIISAFIAVSLYRNVQRRKDLTEANVTSGSSLSKEMRVTKTVLTIATVFTICLIPELAVSVVIITDNTVDFFDPNGGQALLMQLAGFCMGINSCVNFFVYFRSNTVYREHFDNAFPCIKTKK